MSVIDEEGWLINRIYFPQFAKLMNLIHLLKMNVVHTQYLGFFEQSWLERLGEIVDDT